MGKTAMELEIHYFPQTDTLYIGGAGAANEGYDIAENLIAHATEDGEVIGVTLEHAVETLGPYLQEHITNRDSNTAASILRDEGEPR